MHSIDDISNWLRRIGYERFIQQFVENEIDAEVLPDLDISDLAAMQIPVGPAKKILRAIAELNPKPTAPSSTVPEGALTPMPPASQNPMLRDAERRQVTIMFCDMVGSTALSAQFDPEDLSAIVLSFLECCSRTARKYDAHIARYMGDGLLIYFGYPHARENDAERAVRVALEMLRDVSALNPLHDVRVSMRIGIATGMVIGGESVGAESPQESVVMGDTPNLAARLQSSAEPDTILISAKTMKLAGSTYHYRDAGTRRFKGFDRPVPVYEVLGEQILDSRFNSAHAKPLLPMLGREHELALVLERYSQSCDGDGQVVVITAEAGMGKSRIARAAIDALPAGSQHVIYLQCTPYYEQSALYPFVQYFLHLAGIQNTDTADTSFQKLRDALRNAGESDAVSIGVIAQMMGLGQETHEDVYAMPAQQRRTRLLDTLRGFLIRLADQHPLLVLIEDIHWIDPTTRSLIELTIESIESKRVLIIATERPHDDQQYFASPITSRLMLNRLGRLTVIRMIQSMTEHLPLSDEIITEIAAKTDGVPLYIEEITKSAIELEQLSPADQSSKPIHSAIKKLAIPSSLHDSLMERLDRLSVVKEYVQVGSVLGREFNFTLLAATLDRPEAEITAALDQLVKAGLLSCVGHPPDAIYSFKHSLIRDAAYESMLKRRCQHWHSRVASTIESEFPLIADHEPEILALHYANSDFNEQSLKYWVKAADLSLDQFNLSEAVDKTSNGLQQAALIKDGQLKNELTLRLQLVRALALRGLNGFTDPESATSFENAMTLARPLQDWDRYFAAARGLCVSLYIRGMLPQAHELASRVISESNEARHLVNVHLTLGQVLYYQGSQQEAKQHLTKALELVDVLKAGTELSRQFDERCAIEQFLQQTLDLTGEIDQALAVAERAYRRACDLAQPLAIAGTLCHLCLTKLRLKLPCNDESKAFLAITEQYRLPFWKIWATYCCALASNNTSEKTRIVVNRSREQLQSMGVKLGLSSIMVAEAKLLLTQHKPAEALRLISDAKIYLDETSERYYESEIFRLEGEVYRSTQETEQAEACYRNALTIATEQHAAWWQLQAAISLYSLKNEEPDIRQALETIYEKFRNYDLPDVKAAAKLL